MFTSSLIQRAYQLTEKHTSTPQIDDLRMSLVDTLLDHHKIGNNGDLLTPLNFYLGILENSNLTLIRYLSDEQKKTLLRHLQVTYLLLLAETKYEQIHQKTENKQKYKNYCEQCKQFLDELQGEPSKDSPTYYLYLEAGSLFAKDMMSFTDSTSITKETITNIKAINEKRLYWVWTSSFLGLILDRFPDDFLHTMQAKKMSSSPAPYTGFLSFGLYLFYLGLEMSLLLKHTFMPSIAEKEYTTHWSDRFITQWAQRKFVIINYLFWGPGNLVCFFWLCGRGIAGTWGDVLTLGFLGIDVIVSAWIYEEQRVLHEKQKKDYEDALEDLQGQKDVLMLECDQAKSELRRLQKNTPNYNSNLAQIADLECIIQNKQHQLTECNVQLEALQQARQQCMLEWHYAQKSLTTDIMYAVGLMLSFALLAAPFFPCTVQTIASITLIGGALCFVCSLIYNTTKGQEELEQLNAKITDLTNQYQRKCDHFNRVNVGDDKTRRLLFLEIKNLSLELDKLDIENKKRTMHLIRSTLIESLVPAVALISMVFLPMGGSGIGLIASAAFVSVASYYFIEALFKEGTKELVTFDNDKEYDKFCSQIGQVVFSKPLDVSNEEEITEEVGEETALLQGLGK